MGVRHQVISNVGVPRKWKLPDWFLTKYKRIIDFDKEYWCSITEFGRSYSFDTLEEDIQRVIIELDHEQIRLVFFTGDSDEEAPEVSHVTITKEATVELCAETWAEVQPNRSNENEYR